MIAIKLISNVWLVLIGASGSVAIARYCGLEYHTGQLAIAALAIVSGAAQAFIQYRWP